LCAHAKADEFVADDGGARADPILLDPLVERCLPRRLPHSLALSSQRLCQYIKKKGNIKNGRRVII
jgi:hypothetical protein